MRFEVLQVLTWTGLKFRRLRQNAAAVLRRVAAGEVVEVTDHGRAVARIVPMQVESKLAQLLIDGRVSGATGDLLDIKPMTPIPVKPLLSKILAEMREGERWGRPPRRLGGNENC